MKTAGAPAQPGGARRRGIPRVFGGNRTFPVGLFGKGAARAGLSSALVVVGGGKSDEEAVRIACQLLDSPRGKLYLLYVIVVERAFPVDAEVTPATAKGEEVLRHMEDVAKPYGLEMRAELLQSREAGCAVVQEAVEKNVDAVVLGVPYRERYGTLGFGDTVSYVLRNAPSQVVLWRESPPHNSVSKGG